MKNTVMRIFSVLVVALSMLFLLSSCSDTPVISDTEGEITTDADAITEGDTQPTTDTQTPTGEPWQEDGKLKILTIGNSFSDDTSSYIPNVLKNLGYKNIEIGNMFIDINCRHRNCFRKICRITNCIFAKFTFVSGSTYYAYSRFV